MFVLPASTAQDDDSWTTNGQRVCVRFTILNPSRLSGPTGLCGQFRNSSSFFQYIFSLIFSPVKWTSIDDTMAHHYMVFIYRRRLSKNMDSLIFFIYLESIDRIVKESIDENQSIWSDDLFLPAQSVGVALFFIWCCIWYKSPDFSSWPTSGDRKKTNEMEQSGTGHRMAQCPVVRRPICCVGRLAA